ncbi:melanocortin-2 receptor accessory protein 2-like isoform X1 [Acipenser oxyrinchus oxyrinchus]|uniref:Melanocortin-2 receptor accessory protein 2-like isoform X1 n=1 Tax=Acipenser oxyrinchus oxyrinchus TaxID=40147 RepID=A0AAD8GBE9_ACIOX|nr:melanocortin-2 receptor accessory protein 2-like isoform X1 [Acipenser oxyrinchus oxyrinchus]
MSENSRISNTTSRQASSRPDYVWEYEYYDYEPVSFEGLKAHRYSIVIGFWVGLAVFVIFMFFILTLLTKTGAPHQENPEPSGKHHCMNSFAVDFHRSQESDKVLSRQVVEESHSLFHCYFNEVEHLGRARLDSKASGLKHSSLHTRETLGDNKLDEEMNLAKFNIPNCVSSEQSSTLGDDDLLLCEQPITLNNNADDSSASNPETSSQNPQLRSQTPHGLF